MNVHWARATIKCLAEAIGQQEPASSAGSSLMSHAQGLVLPGVSAKGFYDILRQYLAPLSGHHVEQVGPPVFGRSGLVFDVLYQGGETRRFHLALGNAAVTLSEVTQLGQLKAPTTAAYSDPKKAIRILVNRIVMGSSAKKKALAAVRNPSWLTNLKRIGHYNVLK